MMLAGVACNEAPKEDKTGTTSGDTTTVTTKKEEATTSNMPMDTAAMRKKWMEYKEPGAMHKMMASWDGKYSTEVSMWMDPSKPPMKSTGVCEDKMILGGLYQESVYHGTMEKMPFEGRGILAYDNGQKIFVSTWIDNMGSGIMKLQGPWDEATKSMNLKGKMVDPMDGKEKEIREVVTMMDNNSRKMEMYCTGPDGKEMKTLEIVFKKMK